MANTVDFVRGDGVTHFFTMPTAAWSAGGKLFFTAKPLIDDDATDAAAVINATFTDSVAVNDGTNVKYTCYFPPAATNSIPMAGAEKLQFLGEFQWVSAGGIPTTFPAKKKLEVVVYGDIRRGIT